jgi:hypothetical protein
MRKLKLIYIYGTIIYAIAIILITITIKIMSYFKITDKEICSTSLDIFGTVLCITFVYILLRKYIGFIRERI